MRASVFLLMFGSIINPALIYYVHDWPVITFWGRGWDTFRIRCYTRPYPSLYNLIQCSVLETKYVLACAFVDSVMSSPTLLGEFHPSSETFTAYFEGLEQFFEANSIGHNPADAATAVIQAANRKKSRYDDFDNR